MMTTVGRYIVVPDAETEWGGPVRITEGEKERRDKRYKQAVAFLEQSYGLEKYKPCLPWVERTLYYSDWWASSTEIIVALEFERMGCTVDPQWRVGEMHSHRYDFYVPEWNLLVEVDGDIYHRTPYARERDLRQAKEGVLAGYLVARLKESRIMRDVRKEVRRAIARARCGRSYYDDVLDYEESFRARDEREHEPFYVMPWDRGRA